MPNKKKFGKNIKLKRKMKGGALDPRRTSRLCS